MSSRCLPALIWKRWMLTSNTWSSYNSLLLDRQVDVQGVLERLRVEVSKVKAAHENVGNCPPQISANCKSQTDGELIFFPIKLCGVLVFGSAPPGRFRFQPPRPPQRFVTQRNFVTHNVVTRNFVTYNFSRGRRGTWWRPPSFCVAGVALGDIHLCFAWQAWRLVTSTFVLCGKRGAWWHPPFGGSGDALDAWSPVTPRHFCVAGMALGDIHPRFRWQAWHLATSTFVSRGRRGTWQHPPSFHVAGVVLWDCAGSGDALGSAWSPAALLRGRRGTWWHPSSFHVAGVALGDIHLRFAWQAWYLWNWAGLWWSAWSRCGTALLCEAGVALGDIRRRFTWQAWRLVTSTFVLRGRRGAWWHPPLFCVAGVALGDIHLRFVWQAWRLVTSTFVLRGRRGAWWHPPLFCVAGVALGDIHLRFVWQAWRLVTSTFVLRGSGDALDAWSPVTPRHFCVAGMALGDIHPRFRWQAWHLATSTFVSRGRRGTWQHPPSFHVAGVVLWDCAGSGDALGSAWSPAALLRGRRGTWWHPSSFHVAGVALGDIHLRFAWQAWYLWNWAGLWWSPWSRCGATLLCEGVVASTFVLRGRRGTYGTGLGWRAWSRWCRDILRGRRGTWWHPSSFHVAGVALGDIHLRFAWQAWYLCDWVGSGDALGPAVAPGHFAWQPGTWWHLPSFDAAGVALGDIHRRFAWLWWRAWVCLVACGTFAWQAWHLATSTFVSRGRRGTWRHPPSFCVAGIALGDIHLRFAWQALRLLAHTTLSHTIFHTQFCHTPSFTHNFVTHYLPHTTLKLTHISLSHTTLSHPPLCHTQLCHTQLCHTRLSVTHNFVTHLSHTTLSHLSHTTLSHIALSHTIFVTHNFVTHHLSHTSLSHTHTHTKLCHTPPSRQYRRSWTVRQVLRMPTRGIQRSETPKQGSPLCPRVRFTDRCSRTDPTSHNHLSHTSLLHTIFHTHLGYTPSLPHTPSATHPHTQLFHTQHCHTPSFTHTHTTLVHTTLQIQPFNSSIIHHLPCLSCLPCPAATLCSDYWKKLTCGVIRSLNFSFSDCQGLGMAPLGSVLLWNDMKRLKLLKWLERGNSWNFPGEWISRYTNLFQDVEVSWSFLFWTIIVCWDSKIVSDCRSHDVVWCLMLISYRFISLILRLLGVSWL